MPSHVTGGLQQCSFPGTFPYSRLRMDPAQDMWVYTDNLHRRHAFQDPAVVQKKVVRGALARQHRVFCNLAWDQRQGCRSPLGGAGGAVRIAERHEAVER